GIVHERGSRLRAVEWDCWRTPAGRRPELRLKTIFDGVQELIAEFAPDAVVLEESFVGVDARTALSVGQARGAVMVAPADAGAEPAERELFELLLSVQGVGPKVALAIVSGSSPDELRRAIALEDTARFQAIPGIGKKTAQRVVMELQEKLGTVGEAGEPTPLEPKPHLVARDALVELGYSIAE